MNEGTGKTRTNQSQSARQIQIEFKAEMNEIELKNNN